MFLYTVTFYCPSSSVGLFFLDPGEVAALPPTPVCERLAGVVTEKLSFIAAAEAGGCLHSLKSYQFQALLSILGKVREPLEHWKVAFLIFKLFKDDAEQQCSCMPGVAPCSILIAGFLLEAVTIVACFIRFTRVKAGESRLTIHAHVL